ncbi:MAG: hypothetical protein J6S12_00695, partial [Alphaproteobacteria bacterium]|nr:hypothetical protein [Alphaproteobacteria bacterium]
ETYTPLIEQSCHAAGISSKMADTISESKKTKNASICNAEIQNCMLSANRCTTSFEKCESSTDFDKNFSICSSESPGCGEFLADIRTELTKSRDTIFAKAEGALLGFIKKLQTDRAQKIAAAKAGCENKHDYEECIQEKCKNNMPGKCTGEFEKSEKSSAAQLCTFLLNACDALRIEEDEKDK